MVRRLINIFLYRAIGKKPKDGSLDKFIHKCQKEAENKVKGTYFVHNFIKKVK